MTLFLVDYSNKYAIYFSSPKAWVMWAIIDLHDYLMFILLNIFVIVIVFFVYCLIYRFKLLNNFSFNLLEYTHFKLENTNHAPYLEFFWTMIPVCLLVCMGWPSFKLLYAMEQLIDPFHTVVIIGNQWYWTYQYTDNDVIYNMIYELDYNLFYNYKKDALESCETKDYLSTKHVVNNYIVFKHFIQLIGKHFRSYEDYQIVYDSVIISEENLPLNYPRLLSVDQVLILPCDVPIRLLITSADVIHSWALPSQGIKMDAIPGRINQVPFLCNFWGTYWGQCSELCGINHGFMPIEVRVLPFRDYLTYIDLNLIFRYEKFKPMLYKFFNLYINHLKYKSEKNLYSNFNEFIFNSTHNNKSNAILDNNLLVIFYKNKGNLRNVSSKNLEVF